MDTYGRRSLIDFPGRRTRALAAYLKPGRVVFLRSKICQPLLSASPRGYPCGFATVAVTGSGWLLSSNEMQPLLGTRAPGVPRLGSSRRLARHFRHHNLSTAVDCTLIFSQLSRHLFRSSVALKIHNLGSGEKGLSPFSVSAISAAGYSLPSR